MSDIRRNDPCPCGSGLKYKKCCLIENEAERSSYVQVNRARNVFYQSFLEFVEGELENLDQHMKDFEELIGEPVGNHNVYLLTRWLGDRDMGDGQRVFDRFLSENPLEPLEREVAEGYSQAVSRFYRVEAVEPNRYIDARDIVSDTLCRFHDVNLAGQFAPGVVLSVTTYQVGELHLVDSNAVNFTAIVSELLDELGEEAQASGRTLEEHASYLEREHLEFYRFLRKMFEKMVATPVLADVDGEPVVVSRASYKVGKPAKVAAFLSDNGEFQVIEGSGNDGDVFAVWTGTPDSDSVFGGIKLADGELVMETNSKSRLERMKTLLDEALGSSIIFEGETFQDMEEMLEDREIEAVGSKL